MARVQSAAVIVEGNSFLDFVEVDFAIMCARAGENRMKTSAGRTLAKADAIYLSTIDEVDGATARARFDQWRAGLSIGINLNGLPVFTREDILFLVERIREVGVAEPAKDFRAWRRSLQARMPALQ
jgi:hypothetical protein